MVSTKVPGRLCVCENTWLCSIMTSFIVTAVMIVTIVLNSLSLVVFTRSKELKRHHINYFMVSLTVADLCNGLVAHTTSVALTWVGRSENLSAGLEPWLPTGIGLLQMLFSCITMYSLAGVCMVKFLSIQFPLRYESLVTDQRCVIAVMTIWTLVTIFVCLNALWIRMYFDFYVFGCLFDGYNPIYLLIVAVGIPTLVILLCSAHICVVLWKKTRLVSNQGPIPQTFVNSFRSAKKVVVMCSVYLMTYIPIIVHANLHRELGDGWLTFVAFWLLMCGSFLDNALYLVNHNIVQREFRKVLFSRRKVDVVIQVIS